ncbi:glycosyltransferase family 4 protein [Moritella sp. 36]|uniref:glycosyltransferase family 4 protein n=1 Tax=Moritella sp. 36 TaxID=2746233 RepID=UPI002106BCDD|nr:glycosyltransferase family 4 protein [Moritella sp. 36]
MIGCLFLILGKIFRKKITFTMHGTLTIEKRFRNIAKYRLFFEYLLVNYSHKVVTVSNRLGKSVAKLYKIEPDRIKAIPNGVLPPLKTDIKQNFKSNDIICIGGGRPEKRILSVCNAVNKIIKDENIKLNIKVFGEDGKDTELIKKFDFVEYCGFVSHEQLLSELDDSLIFIQFSLYEPFCLSLFDAINSKCKIILSSEIGAIDYLTLNDSNSISIVREPDDLAHEIYSQINSDSPSYSSYDKMGWSLVSEKYILLWESLQSDSSSDEHSDS